MKKIIFLTLFVGSLFAKSNYCIQVAEIYRFDENNIAPYIQRVIDNFDKARIDKRGKHLILRVGDYKKYSSALKDLKKVKSHRFRDAFIRRCDYIESKIVYPKIKEDKIIEENTIEEPLVEEKPKLVPKEQKVLENINIKDSKKIKKYGYDFWQECKKCFAPMENEEEFIQESKPKEEVIKPDSVIEKDNFFEKHSKQKDIKPVLKESDSFFGGKFNFEKNKPKHEEEVIDIKDDKQEDIIKVNLEEKKEKDVKDIDKENNIKEELLLEISDDEDEIKDMPEKTIKKESIKTKKEDNAIKEKDEDDELYDMFGITDL